MFNNIFKKNIGQSKRISSTTPDPWHPHPPWAAAPRKAAAKAAQRPTFRGVGCQRLTVGGGDPMENGDFVELFIGFSMGFEPSTTWIGMKKGDLVDDGNRFFPKDELEKDGDWSWTQMLGPPYAMFMRGAISSWMCGCVCMWLNMRNYNTCLTCKFRHIFRVSLCIHWYEVVMLVKYI